MEHPGKYIAILLVCLSVTASAQETGIVSWDYRGQKFTEFVKGAELLLPVRFFYIDDWVDEIILGDYGDNPAIGDVLHRLFEGKSIYWYSEAGNIILTRAFAIKTGRETSRKDREFLPGMDYSSEKTENGAEGNIFIDIGNPADRNKPGSVELSGYVVNTATREPVAGVTVYIPGLKAGTITNAFGFYKINLPRGSFSVRFSFIGMKEKTMDVNLFSSGELNAELRDVLVPLKEAVITAEKDATLQRFGTGIEKINITTFRLMPTSMGESDIIRSILMVPGVSSVGEGAAGINVRGGSADQNLILLYGAPLYNSSHFFGFFSAVNSDIIRNVTLYKGGIPGRYGGRLSSVLEIEPREGNRKEFSGNAGISPVTTHFVLEGPLIRDTLFYLVTGRTTYSDWILNFINNPRLNNSRIQFNDLNARVAYEINRNNKIDISAYFSRDGFRLNSDTTYSYRNSIASMRWRHYFSSRFFTALTINNSTYGYNISSMKVPEESFRLRHNISTTNLKADFNWFPARNEINFGADIGQHDVIPGSFMPAGDSSIVIPYRVERQKAIETALYVEDKYNITSELSVNAGIRYSTFFALGPQTVFLYDQGQPRNASTINDTISYGSNRNYTTYSGPELRLSANLRLNASSSLRLNYNHTIQYLHLLTNTAAISPSDTWKLSDYHLKPQTGNQMGAGYYTILNRDRLELSVEAYYKMMDNMIDFKGGTNLIMNEHIERDLINVLGRAYGIELLVRKPEGRIRWSAGYTYSRALIRSKGTTGEEMINAGKWLPANFDRPYDLVLIINCLYSRRVSLSATYNFSSGRPVTYPVASYTIGDIIITHFSERNRYRIPNYSRLDISVKISGNLKSKKIAHPHWIFSVYNMTGRNNVYSAFFKNVNNTVRGYYMSIFPRPIPSLSFNFDF